MKINTREMSYEEVLKLPKLKHKRPLKPQMWLATIVRLVCAPTLWKTKFTLEEKRVMSKYNVYLILYGAVYYLVGHVKRDKYSLDLTLRVGTNLKSVVVPFARKLARDYFAKLIVKFKYFHFISPSIYFQGHKSFCFHRYNPIRPTLVRHA